MSTHNACLEFATDLSSNVIFTTGREYLYCGERVGGSAHKIGPGLHKLQSTVPANPSQFTGITDQRVWMVK